MKTMRIVAIVGRLLKKHRIPEKRIGNGLRFLRCLDVLCSYWQYLQEAQ